MPDLISQAAKTGTNVGVLPEEATNRSANLWNRHYAIKLHGEASLSFSSVLERRKHGE